MDTYRIESKFKTARGVVLDWHDVQGSWNAAAHERRIWYEHGVAAAAASRARNPAMHDRWVQQMKKEAEDRGFPLLEDSPELPGSVEDWDFGQSVVEVQALAPECSLHVHYYQSDADLVLQARSYVNPQYSKTYLVADPAFSSPRRPNPGHSREDVDGYCAGPHSTEALALLNPRCFFHGREPHWDEKVDMTYLDLSTYLVPIHRTIPLTDPRMLGDEYNPTIYHDTEQIELIIAAERNVVLEWRALFDGKVYERHYFTELHFDEPMDEADFYPKGRSEA